MSLRIERNEAHSRLAELMTRARNGERVVITENGEAVARLVPATEQAARRRNESRALVSLEPGHEPSDARMQRLQSESEVPPRMRELPKRPS